MTNYTKIAKPVNTPYTRLNPIGREQYDQASITFDSATTFYDGINQSFYTKVTKPVSTTYTKVTKPA